MKRKSFLFTLGLFSVADLGLRFKQILEICGIPIRKVMELVRRFVIAGVQIR